jgi:hypothetical protein
MGRSRRPHSPRVGHPIAAGASGAARAARSGHDTLLLRGRAVRELFGSPLRLALVEQLGRDGERSVRDLAARLDRPADGLYFHVRKLQKIGVLVAGGQRPGARRPEQLYRLAAGRIGVDPRDASPAARSAAALGVMAVLRRSGREFVAAYGSGRAVTEGRRRELIALRVKTWLDGAARAELNRRIDALLGFLRRRADERRGTPCSLTLLVAPSPAVARRRSSP